MRGCWLWRPRGAGGVRGPCQGCGVIHRTTLPGWTLTSFVLFGGTGNPRQLATRLAGPAAPGGGDAEQCQMIIYDCRYPYEYDGGHILGAVNLDVTTAEESLHSVYFEKMGAPRVCRNVVIVFHCEFSRRRGPMAYHAFRNLDRQFNHARRNYPHLCYPEIYLLHGGYKAFFAKFPVGPVRARDPPRRVPWLIV